MKKIFVFAVFAMISAIACANPWSYHGPKRDIVTLVVTANYEKPRLIAELIQDESLQPFLLIPVKNDGNIYFCPPAHLGSAKFIDKNKLGNIVAFISPKQIIVLGNEKYVPAEYVAELRKIAPVVVVNADNWQQAADTVAPMLNLSRLSRNYRKLSAKLESGRLYTPEKKDDEVLQPVKTDKKNDAVSDEPQLEKNVGNEKKSEDKAPSAKAADVAPLA